MTDLSRFLFTGRIPGEFFFEAQTVGHDGFLAAVFPYSLGAVPVSETAVFNTAHGRLGNDVVDKAIVDADGAALKRFSELPGGAFIS